MFFQLLVIEARSRIRIRRNDGSFSVLRDDDAFAFKLEIGALDGDHAYLQGNRHGANGWNLLARLPLPEDHPLPDLLHDLEVHWPAIRLRDDDGGVHLCIVSIHRERNEATQFILRFMDLLTSSRR